MKAEPCKLPDGAFYKRFGNEAVISLSNGDYVSLNETASAMMELYFEGSEPELIARRISKKYGVSFAEVENDLNQLLIELKLLQLLR